MVDKMSETDTTVLASKCRNNFHRWQMEVNTAEPEQVDKWCGAEMSDHLRKAVASYYSNRYQYPTLV